LLAFLLRAERSFFQATTKIPQLLFFFFFPSGFPVMPECE